jgi:hypothetical protein
LFLKTKNGHQVCDISEVTFDCRNDNFRQFLPEEYTAHHEAVFVDAASTLILLAGVPLCSLEMVIDFHLFVIFTLINNEYLRLSSNTTRRKHSKYWITSSADHETRSLMYSLKNNVIFLRDSILLFGSFFHITFVGFAYILI